MQNRFPRFFRPSKRVFNSRSNSVSPNSESNKNEGKQQELPPITINVPESNNAASIKEQRTANRLARINSIVSAALLFCTLGALYYTHKSVQISETSVITSQQSLAYARKKDSLSDIKDSINHIVDSFSIARQDEKDILNYRLNEKSLNAQVGSIKETQKQFEKVNRAYLGIDSFSIGDIKPEQPTQIIIKFRNYGKSPAFVTSYTVNVSLERMLHPPNGDIGKKYFFNYQVAPNMPFTQPVTIGRYALNYYNDIANLKGFLLVFGIVHYRDIVSEKNMVFKYSFAIRTDHLAMFTDEHNGNFEDKY